MTSSGANQQQPQLMNGGENEDPYRSEGRIELKIENFAAGFVQKQLGYECYSEPALYVYGLPWKISASLLESGEDGQQKQKCLGYYLECATDRDLFTSYLVTAQMKVLAQKKEDGKTADDFVRKHRWTFVNDEQAKGFLDFMTIEELMKPDKGWYDELADCIVLAVDFIVDAAGEGGNNEYVLVGGNELKLDRVPMTFSMQIGQLEWGINFDFDDRNKREGGKSLVLSCKDVAKANRGVDKVLLELFGYRKVNAELYFENADAVHRHLFTRANNSLTVKLPAGFIFNNMLFIIRVSTECSNFPDFTKPNATVGRFSANVRLRVGDQLFHVNRQLLSTHSLFFDRMFHGDYTAATQQEVELSLITHSPELFRQFLLVLCINEILPNSMNVSALFKLADFYDAENVHKKCDQHLRMAREMPLEKRVLLARAHGTEKTHDLIMESVNLEQSKRINLMFMKNRSL